MIVYKTNETIVDDITMHNVFRYCVCDECKIEEFGCSYAGDGNDLEDRSAQTWIETAESYLCKSCQAKN